MVNLKGLLERCSSHMFKAGSADPGQSLSARERYESLVENLILDHALSTVVDCGCGEFGFPNIKHFPGVRYVGIDLDPRLTTLNTSHSGSDKIRFLCADFLSMQFPATDLFLCKDVLNHLPTASIIDLLKQLPRFRYALFTYDKGPNEGRPDSFSEEESLYAPLDLLAPPFSLAGIEAPAGGSRVSFLVRGGGDGSGRLDFERLFAGQTARPDWPSTQPTASPRVLLSIQGGARTGLRPDLLNHIEALDYPKASLLLRIPASGGSGTGLEDWVSQARRRYGWVEHGTPAACGAALEAALEWGCDFCLLLDPATFLAAGSLRALVALDLPLVAPFLVPADPLEPHGNFLCDHEEIHAWIRTRRMRGIFEVQAAPGTCLIRRDIMPRLCGVDSLASLSDCAAREGILQYLDNRQAYGGWFSEASARADEALMEAGPLSLDPPRPVASAGVRVHRFTVN